jgi:hypothetical protein
MDAEDSIREMTRLQYRPDAPGRLDSTSPEDGERVIKESFRIARRFLGDEWVDRQFDSKVRHTDGGLGLAAEWVGPESLNRLFSLARELHDAQDLPGFSAFVRDLRSRSLLAAVAEMKAVRHCADGGQGVRFIDPNRLLGRQPDAITLLSGVAVAVEVKVRKTLPTSAYSDEKILSTLGSARKQLPTSGPSLIYLGIGPPWSEDETTMIAIHRACRTFLRKTRRVNAVVLMMEIRLPHPDGSGMAFQSSFLTVPNHDPHIWLPDIQDWLLTDHGLA